MVYLNSLLEITKPSGLWYIIFNWIDGFTFNFGWTIIIFTVMIKLILSPLDLYNRYSTKKNTLITKRLAPQVEKINKTYAADRAKANQQVNILYKKEGYSMIGSCLFTLLNLVLTIVIFFTIFSSLRTTSNYKMLTQYVELENVYNTTEGTKEEKETAVINHYEEIKDNWLWINNIWKTDSNTKPISTYEEFKNSLNNSKEYKAYVEENVSEEKYNEVTGALQQKYEKTWNGYFILAVLAALTSFLSQFMAELGNKVSKKKKSTTDPINPTENATKQAMNVMKYVLPIIMVIFVVTNTASFGIYIVISSLISTILSFAINAIVKKMTHKEELKYLDFVEKNNLKTIKKQQVVYERPKMKPGAKL